MFGTIKHNVKALYRFGRKPGWLLTIKSKRIKCSRRILVSDVISSSDGKMKDGTLHFCPWLRVQAATPNVDVPNWRWQPVHRCNKSYCNLFALLLLIIGIPRVRKNAASPLPVAIFDEKRMWMRRWEIFLPHRSTSDLFNHTDRVLLISDTGLLHRAFRN